MPARVARPAFALVAAAVLAAGLSACGHAPNPTYRTGYDAGLTARSRFVQQHGASTNLPWLCAQAAFQHIQDMANTTATTWEDGFNKGCANEST